MLGFLSRLLSSTARVIRETVRLVYDVTTGLFVRRVDRHVEPPAPSLDMDSMMHGVSQALEMSRAAATVKRHAKAVTEGRRDRDDVPELPEAVRAWLSVLSSRHLRLIAETPLARVREHVKGKRAILGLPAIDDIVAQPTGRVMRPLSPRVPQGLGSRIRDRVQREDDRLSDEWVRALLS